MSKLTDPGTSPSASEDPCSAVCIASGQALGVLLKAGRPQAAKFSSDVTLAASRSLGARGLWVSQKRMHPVTWHFT